MVVLESFLKEEKELDSKIKDFASWIMCRDISVTYDLRELERRAKVLLDDVEQFKKKKYKEIV
jgi:hypothetical protein